MAGDNNRLRKGFAEKLVRQDEEFVTPIRKKNIERAVW